MSEDDIRYVVVQNDEEQFSVWPEYDKLPEGWSSIGFSGTRGECLANIDQIWTDMRPLSLRMAMDEERE